MRRSVLSPRSNAEADRSRFRCCRMQLRRKGGYHRRFWRGTPWETPGNITFPGFIGLAVFSFEPSAAHHVPTEIDHGISRISREFPGGIWGGVGAFGRHRRLARSQAAFVEHVLPTMPLPRPAANRKGIVRDARRERPGGLFHS